MKFDLITKEEFLGIFEELEAIKESITNLNTSPSKKWYNEREAMEYLSVSKSTIQSYRKKGLIEFSQYANKIHYKLSDLDAFLESNYTGTKQQFAGREVAPW